MAGLALDAAGDVAIGAEVGGMSGAEGEKTGRQNESEKALRLHGGFSLGERRGLP